MSSSDAALLPMTRFPSYHLFSLDRKESIAQGMRWKKYIRSRPRSKSRRTRTSIFLAPSSDSAQELNFTRQVASRLGLKLPAHSLQSVDLFAFEKPSQNAR